MSNRRKPVVYTYFFSMFMMFVVFMIYIYIYIDGDAKGFYYDASYYWTAADGVFNSGTINLLNFPETFRGCLYTLLLSGIKYFGRVLLGNEVLAFQIAQAFVLASLFGVALPYMLDIRITDLKSLFRLLLCSGLVLYFWGGLCKVPLSDMPAVVSFCYGLALLKFVCAEDEDVRRTKLQCYTGAFVAGICLYFSYNTRVAYLYGIAVCFIGFIIFVIRSRKLRYLGILFSLILGAFVAAYPQMVINQYYTGQFSPKVFTEQLSNYSTSLQKTQVLWGLQIHRYETYVGPLSQYPSPSVYYFDPVGLKLIAHEGLTGDNFTYLSLLKMFINYPLDVCGIYARHLVSLLTPVYSDVYIHDIYENNTFRVAFNVVLWILAGIGTCTISIKKLGKHNITKLIALLGLIVPSLLQLFGAPEVRFFLAVHLLLYYWLCFVVEWKKAMSFCKKNLLPVLLAIVVVFFAWTTLIGNILISADSENGMLISGNYTEYSTMAVINEGA